MNEFVFEMSFEHGVYKDSIFLDQTLYSNLSRYISHTCKSPNLDIIDAINGVLPVIRLKSLKNIFPKDPLTINYQYKFDIDNIDDYEIPLIKCLCYKLYKEE